MEWHISVLQRFLDRISQGALRVQLVSPQMGSALRCNVDHEDSTGESERQSETERQRGTAKIRGKQPHGHEHPQTDHTGQNKRGQSDRQWQQQTERHNVNQSNHTTWCVSSKMRRSRVDFSYRSRWGQIWALNLTFQGPSHLTISPLWTGWLAPIK